MKPKSCIAAFLEFVGAPFATKDGEAVTPYDCWEDDGFWPERVRADLAHLHVWGTLVGMSYLENGGMAAFLQFISGRTLPEMVEGLVVLGCPRSAAVCRRVVEMLGNPFARNDQLRAQLTAENEEDLRKRESELWKAMEKDGYRDRVESYCRGFCSTNGITFN